MKKQDYDNMKLSSNLKKFIDNNKQVEYSNYGNCAQVKIATREIIRKQLSEMEQIRKEIWMATEICQPFLFLNDNVLDIRGVLDYNPISQVGCFYNSTVDGDLIVKNVHSYHVFFNIENKYLPGNSRYLPEKDEISDMYLSAIVAEGGNFKLQIYHNTKLIYIHDNVFESEYIFYGENTSYKKRLAYIRFASQLQDDNNTYLNYMFDISKELVISLDDSINKPSWYIRYREHDETDWSRFKERIFSHGYGITIYLHLNNSKQSQIIKECIKEADCIKVCENIFSDDDTYNIEVTYINKPDKVRFLYYCAKLNKKIFGHGIYNISIGDIEKGTLNNKYEYKSFLTLPENTVKYYKKINQELFEKCNETIKINCLPSKVYNSYISYHDMIVYMYQYLRDYPGGAYEVPWILGYMGRSNLSFKNERLLYNCIFHQLAKENKLIIKWKNEYDLYVLIQTIYDDAIYQYNSDWLGRQSLDVFIPSINVGIEYQGQQHFRPIPYFGGKETYEKVIHCDKLKKEKCKNNNVHLIEWKYDEPISKYILYDKLSDLMLIKSH